MTPKKKISETILEFGDFLMRGLTDNATKEEFEQLLRFVVSAWNAVVLDQWDKTDCAEKKFLEALSPLGMETQVLAKTLISRKKEKYSSDIRAVGDYRVLEKAGRFVPRVEARGKPK